ncbi:MAG TPA: farnesyl diphosphate synthase [Pyrinomonadaceae bacterium]|nr:farnesyl diphosphate synthase [Pyrinomonadaceae bacterium]
MKHSATSNAREFFASCRPLIDAELDRLIPKSTASPERVHAAIRWSVFAGGKRFRPALVIAVGQTFGASIDRLIRTACAFEMIHTYSLIHDDLPSMDDDDLRRGRATCHVQFDEATAILAGDALQALAFQTVSEDQNLSPELRVQLTSELARASGVPSGMVAGQALDLEAELSAAASVEVSRIHAHKTGALIYAAARAGAHIAGAGDDELAAITDYGVNLGLLFQITDDLLDVTATAAELGKTPGKDARAKKATFPAIYGIETTHKTIAAVHQTTWGELKRIERSTRLLHSIADYIFNRGA